MKHLALYHISAAASEGLATIQSEWNQLPAFFDGLWTGAGSAASAAGSAIASGINSAIGTIQSAWESLASWLSTKISSLSQMASNAASAVTGFFSGGGVGHNAKGTNFWRGGFTEINERGGEIIDLPQGTRIYPHATTVNIIRDELQKGKLDNLITSEGFNGSTASSFNPLDSATVTFNYDELGNIKNYDGISDNLILSDDDLLVRNAKIKTQQEQLNLSTYPEALQVSELNKEILNSSTSTNKSNNNGVTISGNTFNVRAYSDIDKIAFKIFELMSDANTNYPGA